MPLKPPPKILTLLVLLSFAAVFGFAPQPAYAGGIVGSIGRIILGVVAGVIIGAACFGSYGAACVFLKTVSWFFSTPLMVAVTGFLFAAEPLIGYSSCSGSYDPIFGTCTREKRETQQIFNTAGAKFSKFTLAGPPSPEDFARNPNSREKVTIEWLSVGQPGLINYMTVKDQSGSRVCASAGNSCSAGAQTSVCDLPYDGSYMAEVWFAACYQAAAKGVRPTCDGCGGDAVGAKKEFTTSSIPLPAVDLKADGKDLITTAAGTPAKLTWVSNYAASCEAGGSLSGSWSGNLPTSGSRTVIPTTDKEVYTITCKRGEKSGSDSVSFSAPASKEIKVFGTAGGGSGGGAGGLQILEFNVPPVLNPGDTVTISWSVQGAKSCEVDQGIGQIPLVGSANITFLKEITFTMTCIDESGFSMSVQKAIRVRSIPAVREIAPE